MSRTLTFSKLIYLFSIVGGNTFDYIDESECDDDLLESISIGCLCILFLSMGSYRDKLTFYKLTFIGY